MSDLVAFLRARLDDEARLATAASHAGLGIDIGPDGHAVSSHPDAQDHIATWYPRRVLAEVDAKRRIVDKLAAMCQAADELDRNDPMGAGYDEAPDLLRLLGLPYADHPDYDPSWKPA